MFLEDEGSLEVLFDIGMSILDGRVYRILKSAGYFYPFLTSSRSVSASDCPKLLISADSPILSSVSWD